jgi:8-oxo-dGTP diphosphatase
MRAWLVASGIVEGPEGLLLVQNRRRDGSLDWSPPGGVIEIESGESSVEGLTREVLEETGITVTDWLGPLWTVEAEAPEAGFTLRVEVYRAVTFEGQLAVDDPDGIVVDARFFPLRDCHVQVASTTWIPTHEPLGEWLAERWDEAREYRYRIAGAQRSEMIVERL